MTDEINPLIKAVENVSITHGPTTASIGIGKKLGLLDGKELLLRVSANQITIQDALNEIDLLLKETGKMNSGYQTK